jgi:hypothetical protein
MGHYKYRVYEESHYYLTNRASVIIFSHLFEGCRYVCETPYLAHLQTYWFEEGGEMFLLPSSSTSFHPPAFFFISSTATAQAQPPAAAQTARDGARARA